MSIPKLAGLAFALTAAGVAAQRLPDSVTPSRYQLRFTPDLGAETFRGEEKLTVRLSRPATELVLNAAELSFEEVKIQQGAVTQTAKVTVDDPGERVTFAVAKPLGAGEATVQVRYAGKLNGDLRGFYLAKTAKRKYAVTQFENTDARRAFPSFDEPAFKAVFEISLVVDRGDVAMSNMKVVSDTPGPDEGKHTVRFAPSPKMSSYLVAMAVGDFQCEGGEADGIPIRVCATPEGKGKLGTALAAARFVMPFYDRYFGIKYPYGKLDFLAMPDFQAGAMENVGLIVARDALTLVDDSTSYGTRKFATQEVVAHEMAHQWFGDLVTMKWWDDIWLNEGFATWMAFKPIEAFQPGWNVASDAVQSSMAAVGADGLANTHPIHQKADNPAQIKELFDAISYNKTAAVLSMVEGYVGEEPFRKGVSAYLKRYQYSNAAAPDFWKEIAVASGKPADQIMESFVMQPGVPVVSVGTRCADGATEVTLAQRRYFANRARFLQGSPESWKVPVCLRAGATRKCVLLSSAAQTLRFPGCEAVYGNAGAGGYYVTGYQPDNLALLAKAAPSLSTPERTLLLGDAAAGLTVGLLDAGDLLVLASGLKDDPNRPVVDLIAGAVARLDGQLVSDASRPAYRAWVQSVFGPVAEKLGDPVAGEPEERRALRADFWAIDGLIGRDPKLMKKARELVERALRGEPVDGTLLNTAIPIAAVGGDAALFEAFTKAVEAPRSAEDALRYVTGLGQFEDPALVRRALGYGLSPKVRTQDAIYLFGTALSLRSSRTLAWAFIREHWSEVIAKMPEAHHPYFVGALSGFCEAQSRREIEKFLADHPLAPAERATKQALEAIDNCIDLRAAQGAKLDAWLAVHRG